MKIDTKSIEAALERRRSLDTEVANLHTLAAENGTRLAELELGADLEDSGKMDEVVRRQAIAKLLPARVAARTEAVAEVDQSLLRTCHEITASQISPALRKLRAENIEQAKKDLAPHFADADGLNQAAENSAVVRRVDSFIQTITIRHPAPQEVVGYAEALLGVVQQAFAKP